ncbi:hypothetical protein ACNKHQ_02890 [Shigella flexneri]
MTLNGQESARNWQLALLSGQFLKKEYVSHQRSDAEQIVRDAGKQRAMKRCLAQVFDVQDV